MAFSSQFALSVELSRLVPQPVVNVFSAPLLALARELTASGSDIVVEEDLAMVFGRMRICPHFEKTFRMGVGATDVTMISKIVDIALESGPGPTVRRALTAPIEDFRYLSTVIQLSLLSYAHDINSLTQGLSDALNQRLEGASPNHNHAPVPNFTSIFNLLRACNEQTCKFQWRYVLDSVEKQLYPTHMSTLNSEDSFTAHDGTKEGHFNTSISSIVLQGLLDMLLAVQRLPEHRTIYIHTTLGIPTIVAWAHHVLGLNVQVNMPKFPRAQGYDTLKKFGHGPAQVIIDAQSRLNVLSLSGGSICLLDATDDQPLFHLKEESDEERSLVMAALRYPLRGYAKRIILKKIKWGGGRLESDEIEHLLRLAAIDSVVLSMKKFFTNTTKLHACQTQGGYDDILKHSPFYEWDKVEEMTEMMFEINVPHLKSSVFDGLLQPGVHEDTSVSEDISAGGKSLYHSVETLLPRLAFLLRAFVCADDIEACADFPIFDIGWVEHTCIMATYSQPADGWLNARQASQDPRNEATLLGCFEELLQIQAQSARLSDSSTCLVSEFGWTVFLPSLTIIDPHEVSRYRICIRRGLPTRRGDVRRQVLSNSFIGTTTPSNERRAEVDAQHLAVSTSDRLTIFDAINTSNSDASEASIQSQVGTTPSSFVVMVVFRNSSQISMNVGIQHLHELGVSLNLWKMENCRHTEHDRFDPMFELDYKGQACVVSTSNFVLKTDTDKRMSQDEFGYCLVTTADSIASRWMCIISSLPRISSKREPVLCLRGLNTCMQCGVRRPLEHYIHEGVGQAPRTIIL